MQTRYRIIRTNGLNTQDDFLRQCYASAPLTPIYELQVLKKVGWFWKKWEWVFKAGFSDRGAAERALLWEQGEHPLQKERQQAAQEQPEVIKEVA